DMFPTNAYIDVELRASDVAVPPNSATETYRFTTEDRIPPEFDATTLAPRNGAEEVAINTVISVYVSDAPNGDDIEFNSGIDENSINFRVNGVARNFEVVWLGAPYRALIKHNITGLQYCSDVDVDVDCQDLEGNSMPTASWSFKTDGCYSRIRVPETLEFDRTAKDGDPSIEFLTIENVGYQTLNVTAIDVIDGREHFSVPDNLLLPLPIAGQGSYNLAVTFAPKQYGDMNGRIRFRVAADEEGDDTPPAVYTDLIGGAGYPPVVKLVTMQYSEVTSARGGPFTALAEIGDPDGDLDVESVEIKIHSNAIGSIDWGYMNDEGVDGDLVPFNGVYTFQYEFNSYVPPDDYLVTVEVVDRLGYRSTPWPYLRIDEYENYQAPPADDFPNGMALLSAPDSVYCLDSCVDTLVPNKDRSSSSSQKKGTKAEDTGLTRPYIEAAGYGGWEHTFMTTRGGRLMIQARVRNSDSGYGKLGWGSIDEVELLLWDGNRIGDGLFLRDNVATGVYGDVANDGMFVLVLDDVDVQIASGEYVLKLIATDIYGNQSLVWPYFHVE
ncbi:MAG: hypothetical protein JW941_11980, partial [Candidatus Coatesbacteria bacterium]|nr:hypothetical protein [Candidatus Coatesbacteria bacterium]